MARRSSERFWNIDGSSRLGAWTTSHEHVFLRDWKWRCCFPLFVYDVCTHIVSPWRCVFEISNKHGNKIVEYRGTKHVCWFFAEFFQLAKWKIKLHDMSKNQKNNNDFQSLWKHCSLETHVQHHIWYFWNWENMRIHLTCDFRLTVFMLTFLRVSALTFPAFSFGHEVLSMRAAGSRCGHLKSDQEQIKQTIFFSTTKTLSSRKQSRK